MLDFLVSPAHAQGAAPQGDLFGFFVPMIIMVVLFYFILIRPQMKRSKEHRDMLGKLATVLEVEPADMLKRPTRNAR